MARYPSFLRHFSDLAHQALWTGLIVGALVVLFASIPTHDMFVALRLHWGWIYTITALLTLVVMYLWFIRRKEPLWLILLASLWGLFWMVLLSGGLLLAVYLMMPHTPA